MFIHEIIYQILWIMLKGKTLTDFTNLFFPYNLKKIDQVILNYFWKKIWEYKNHMCISWNKFIRK